MSQELKVMFFNNGNTAVFRNGKQVPELQQSWLLKFAEFLAANNIDPAECEMHLPDGGVARIFHTEEPGYTWVLL